jgi:hypothetical protein
MAHRISRPTRSHPIFGSGVSLTLCLYGATLLAAPTDNTSTTDASDKLFQEGKELLVAGRNAEACEKLAESYRLEASGGTILYLGACHKAEGKGLIAWSALQEAVRLAQLDARSDRESAAMKLIDELKAEYPKISLELDAATASISGLELNIDGVPILQEHWSAGVPVNPGAHTVVVSARGYRSEQKTVKVDSVTTTHVVHVPKLRADSEAPPDIHPLAPDVSASRASERRGNAHSKAGHEASGGPSGSPSRPSPSSSRGGQVAAGVVFSGLGALGLIVGPVLALHASNLKKDADTLCQRRLDCLTNEGYMMHGNASAYSDASRVLMITGGIAAAAGGITWVVVAAKSTRSEGAASAPLKLSFQAGSRGVFLSGQF